MGMFRCMIIVVLCFFFFLQVGSIVRVALICIDDVVAIQSNWFDTVLALLLLLRDSKCAS